MSEEEQNRKVEEWNRKNDPESSERALHISKLSELDFFVGAVIKLVDGYFDPPNIMACRGSKEQGWDVFIRRKGSAEEFGPGEWQND